MSRRLIVILAGLALVLAVPANALARGERAVLIGVHATRVAFAKPQPTANCSNQPANPGNGGYVFTGWEVSGAKTARLNTSTLPSGLTSNAVVSALNASFDAWEPADANVPNISVATGGTVTKATANPRYDLRNIATHEFGHTFGLSHPDGGRWETMYAYGFTGETLKWSLGAGDTDGVRALY